MPKIDIVALHESLIKSKIYREHSSFDFKQEGANEAHLEMLIRILR